MPTSDPTSPARTRVATTTLLKAGGGALGALAIGVVVALITSPVVFDRNSASSSELPIPLVEIASVRAGQSCTDGNLLWEAKETIRGEAVQVDLLDHMDGGGRWEADVIDVCVRSRTARPTTLGIGTRRLVDTETTCEPTEAAAGDPCDLPADEGELSSTLRVSGGGADSCVDDFFFGVPLSATTGLLPGEVLSPANGRTCRLTFGLYLESTLTTSALAEIQTDQIQFDLELVTTQS